MPLQPPHPHQMYSTSRRHGSEGDRPCQSLANVSARVLARRGGKAGCPPQVQGGREAPCTAATPVSCLLTGIYILPFLSGNKIVSKFGFTSFVF